MTESPLRVAIAGAGMVARLHLDAARRAGAHVIGVCASTPERGREAAERFGLARAFDSADELITSDDVDVVHVCTPNSSHHRLTELALQSGKHVVCEKPLATTSDDADALVKLARSSGLITAVPFVYRYHPMAAEARARVHGGTIGPVRLIHGHYLQDWLSEPGDNNWRVDPLLGGASRAFADIGSHWCDLVEWVTGHRINRLIAMVHTVLPVREGTARGTFSGDDAFAGDDAAAGVGTTVVTTTPMTGRTPVTTEDTAHLLFTTDHGASGALTVSQVSPGRKNRLWFEVDGARASVAFDQENPESLFVGSRTGNATLPRDPALLSPQAARLSVLPAGHPMGYADCFAAFVGQVYAAVRANPHSPAPDGNCFPTFDDAARTVRLTEAVLRSARNHSWTEVS